MSAALDALIDESGAMSGTYAEAAETNAPQQDRSNLSSRNLAAARLHRLAEIFGLTAFEHTVVGTLWISVFDANLRAELLAEEPGNGCVTPRAIARLFGHAECARLASESPLRLWNIVFEHALLDGSASLSLDPHILAWLEGRHELDRVLVGHAAIVQQGIESSAWPMDAWSRRLSEGMRNGMRWRVHIVGAAGKEGRSDPVAELACAAGLGQRLGLPVLRLQLRTASSNADQAAPSAAELLKRLHRQAFLDGSAPCVANHGSAAIDLGAECPPFPIEFVLGPASVTTSPAARSDQNALQLVLPPMQAADRMALWRAALPQAAAWPVDKFERLALESDANASDIVQAAAGQPESPQQAMQALSLQYRDELQGLAQRINAGYRWDDMVLPAGAIERLQEIQFEAHERHALWADSEIARLYPQGRGVIALFSGPPGTGKTMAAQVIAAELGMDLLRVDLSAVVSKWVGETAQHLQQILSARVSRRAVLFFDEADALYGKRVEDTRDAQDRYANMDISHLMVALENFDGVVLLATNLKGNIDGAFMRRIRHTVEFTRPDAAARAAIWQRVLSAVFPAARDIRIDQLATLQATGAQIKQATLSAAFAVRRLRCEPDTLLLAQMLAREMSKDGGGLSARELAAALGQADEHGGGL